MLRFNLQMKIIILTGNETRHKYFRLYISNQVNIKVISSYCENTEKSLENRVKKNPNSSKLENLHVLARTQCEDDFFSESIKYLPDLSNTKLIKKGSINNIEIVSEIIDKNADLLVCYGSSLINSDLLKVYKGKFINVHLGLSPYYRGSGTNIWPLINGEPQMIGATFMHIDEGIDTGEIIHQITTEFFIGDSPHTIGNRLIKKMTMVYAELIQKFSQLHTMQQYEFSGLLYKQKDFNEEACRKLYDQMNNGLIENYLNYRKPKINIITNPGMTE